MRTLLTMAALASTLTACGPSEEAVWLISASPATTSAGTSTCTENLDNANCIESSDPDTGPTTTTITGQVSDGAFFAQIIDGPSGEKYLVFEDLVFVGTREDGVWNFVWDAFDNTTETTEGTSQSYRFQEVTNQTVTTTISLDVSGRDATGTLTTVVDSEVTVRESDLFSVEEFGFTGDLGFRQPANLEGDPTNTAETSECDGDVCEVSVTEQFTITAALTAVRTDLDREGFDGVDNAGQDEGVSGY